MRTEEIGKRYLIYEKIQLFVPAVLPQTSNDLQDAMYNNNRIGVQTKHNNISFLSTQISN